MKKFLTLIVFMLLTLILIPIIYALAHFAIFIFVLMTAAVIAASLVLYISEEVLK